MFQTTTGPPKGLGPEFHIVQAVRIWLMGCTISLKREIHCVQTHIISLSELQRGAYTLPCCNLVNISCTLVESQLPSS